MGSRQESDELGCLPPLYADQAQVQETVPHTLVWVFLPQFNTAPHVRTWKLNNLSQVCLGACLRVQILFNRKATLTIAASLVHGLE